MCAPTFRERIELINKEFWVSVEAADRSFMRVAACFRVPFTRDGIEPGAKSPYLPDMARDEPLDDDVRGDIENFFIQLYYRRLRRNHAKGN